MAGTEYGFYVYTHARPDGRVFYVGKGRHRRAWDFSPSRRTAHHRNIVEKYGLTSIVVTVYPAATEDAAFAEERRMIAEFKAAGVPLINLTSGGEGASGVAMTQARLDALARGRAKRGYHGPGFERFIAAGRLVPTWFGTPAHKAAASDMALRAAATRSAKPPRTFQCPACGVEFSTTAQRVGCCSDRCQQRLRRSREVRPTETKMYATNTSGETGVYFNKRCGVWLAMICVNKKLVYLGRFASKAEAVEARRAAQEEKLRTHGRRSQPRHTQGLSPAS